MTEAEQRELWKLVCAALDAKRTDEFSDRIAAIEERWRDRYEFWLVRNRDRAAAQPVTERAS